MLTPRPGKGHYTEAEAAQALGVSIEELRVLVRRHILQSDDEMANIPITNFQPSDLLLLRLLKSSPVDTASTS
jgi:hypothetical protein